MTPQNSRAKQAGVAFLVGLSLLASQSVDTAKKFSEWSIPTNLGAVVNSQFEDIQPHISKDGLSLFFASDRLDGSFGSFDIWVSQRASRSELWGPPMNLGPNINTNGNDRSMALSRDGHLLFFATQGRIGFGSLDIWVSSRTNTHDDFGWQPPVNLGTGVNGPSPDFGPGLLENDDIGIPILFFASRRLGDLIGGSDIYMSHLLANGSFGAALLITELSTPHDDFRPTIRPDGLELFFDSNRPGPPDIIGIGFRDLWVSTRETVSAPWSSPVNLGPIVNSELDDKDPALSSDGTTLIFDSNRTGSLGSDLYMSFREKGD